MGMRFLKAGASATEAIEASLKILEDREITNAGYGSNLSINGTVECDATVVDHLGRSGACGAVPSPSYPYVPFLPSPCLLTTGIDIRNPISLAKMILDLSNKPLSLRRVPPNALVGEGAKAFAEEHGMLTLDNEHLVSKNARDRFLRWQDDLQRAETKSIDSKLSPSTSPEPNSPGCVPCQYDTATPPEAQNVFPRDHTAAIMAGTWNEGQPDSPYHGTPHTEAKSAAESPNSSSSYFRSALQPTPSVARSPIRATPEKSPLASLAVAGNRLSSKQPHTRSQGKIGDSPTPSTTRGVPVSRASGLSPKDETAQSYRDALMVADAKRWKDTESVSGVAISLNRIVANNPRGVKRPENQMEDGSEHDRSRKRHNHPGGADGVDAITDTIGAIAIDDKGHIAAGSSSGGIGMKHRGRLGPAALVGIGTAVVPSEEDDEEGLTVAAVTSGTGEHMATTMASQRCAERIYRGTRKGPGGGEIQDDDEDAIMESFIADDFMNHPGVRNCHSAGAIGVMVVKKTRLGYYLYFAHNTDSFALASMGGLEKEPVCTMSRLSKDSDIARGGRKIRVE